VTSYAQTAIDEINARLPGLEPGLVSLYALLLLTRGRDTTLANVHDAWALWRLTTRPGHPSLVPFDELALEVQELDRPYLHAILAASP
jgi:hypothetical protein